MVLTSSAFEHSKFVPKKYTCDGDDISPPLNWKDLPKGSASLALIMDDPDAPPGTWDHWAIFDLPSTLTGLSEGVPKKETLDSGAKQALVWGVEGKIAMSRVGYWGPCPPPGKPHRYFFKLYALDKKLSLPPKTTKMELLKAMKDHILAQTELIGLYKR